MKYIGFQPNPGEKYHGYYGKHSSHSHRFLSLELEVAVVALLKLTCDQITQSVVYVQDTDVMPDFFQLEREGPVHQFDGAIQETMKLLMLIGNAVVDILYSYPLTD